MPQTETNKSYSSPTPSPTPLESHPELAKAIGIEKLYLKREDLHPLGSHKGRSISFMIDHYMEKGLRHFAISSSGNAALAAALYISKLNTSLPDNEKITLEIFVGQKINPKKLAKLQELKSAHTLVSIHDRPQQMLFMKIKDPTIQSLRQSTDDTALLGYQSLANELDTIDDLEAVFIGTSSGTTAQALADFFITKYGNKNSGKISPATKTAAVKRKIPEIHIVQTPNCHPLADAIRTDVGDVDDQSQSSEISLADAIVDIIAPRRDTLTRVIVETGGNGWIVNNESLRIAEDITKKHTGLIMSYNSALSVAGIMNAVYTGKKWNGSVVGMICGD